MTLPGNFQPGSRLTADDINRTNNTLSKFERMSVNGGKIAINPVGVSIGIPQPRRTVIEPAHVVRAVNDGDVALLPYAPCGISGHVQTGDDAQYQRVMRVRPPTEDDTGFFAITAEPIPAGEIGRVYVVGVCLCRIKNTGEPGELRFADVEVDGDYLLAASTGGAQILWEDAYEDEDVHLGLVRFPRGGDGVQDWADIVSTANRALTGTPVIDGVSSAGKFVLLVNQTAPAEVGLYSVSVDGDWTFLGQPKRCDILSGTNHSGGAWRLKSANDYDTMSFYWG